MLGWGLDGMDVMLYAFALTTIQKEFDFTSAQAGGLASITLLGSAVGGLAFGYIADRYGRARALIYSILFYSIFTAATATSHSAAELLFWRFLVGLGLGGEWAAGSVLVAESGLPNTVARPSGSYNPAGPWVTSPPRCSPPESCRTTDGASCSSSELHRRS